MILIEYAFLAMWWGGGAIYVGWEELCQENNCNEVPPLSPMLL